MSGHSLRYITIPVNPFQRRPFATIILGDGVGNETRTRPKVAADTEVFALAAVNSLPLLVWVSRRHVHRSLQTKLHSEVGTHSHDSFPDTTRRRRNGPRRDNLPLRIKRST